MKKMQIKVIARDEHEFTRERSNDQVKVFRNADPMLHPFQKAREYTRALNATKLDRVFAKPFLYALDGHGDGVYCMSRVPVSLTSLLAGDGAGELKLWHLGSRQVLWSATAHQGRVRGITCDPYGEIAITCGTDKTLKMWNINHGVSKSASILESDGSTERKIATASPINVFLGQGAFLGVDHHKATTTFASCGAQVDIWDHDRADPVHSFQWGADTVHTVKFNPIETHVFASASSDRNMVLYDIRQKTPLKKIVMQHITNAIAWNPMESYTFVSANEDQNLYTYDMRNLDSARTLHQDHVGAVMSVDYAPTGKEFVSGAYDRSIRIFGADSGHSREVYTARRMQKIFSVQFSADNRYVLSGSDDANIRVWKARASESLKVQLPREKAAAQYQEKLKERYSNTPDVARIARHRQLPSAIYKMKQTKHVMKQSKQRKEANVERHSKPGTVAHVPERKKKIVKVIK